VLRTNRNSGSIGRSLSVAYAAYSNRDLATFWSEFQRIANKVDDYLEDPVLVTPEPICMLAGVRICERNGRLMG
jgi:hypothetical protein